MIKVLDHGFVRFVEAWGGGDYQAGSNEAGIIEAARQSTQGSFRGWDIDERLLHFLYNNKHLSPFEFAGMTIEVKAPIFVFREWHRHRTQSYNEMSARYAPLPNENYVPTSDRITRLDTSKNKQAGAMKDAPPVDLGSAWRFRDALEVIYDNAERAYQDALKRGIPKELARLCLPVGRYSQMRATGNLRNWLAFLTLRQAPEAQWEIRQFANAVADIIAVQFPRTYDLFQGEVEMP